MTKVREISCPLVTEAVKRLFLEANTSLGEDVMDALYRARETETSELGRYVLDQILENAAVAEKWKAPLCQDTGFAVVFLEIGQDVHVIDGDLHEAVREGIRLAYTEGYLRKSVCDPLSRNNTKDNLPAVVHTDIVPGDRLKIVAMPKGGGSENMGGTAMLVPAAGYEGIKRYVIDRVEAAGSNPCPPVIVGVGIGGTMEQSALLAKKALLRPVGKPNDRDERLNRLEREILDEINKSGIGPQGYGGIVTALAVHVEMMPCHIASLPVSVNIQCHVARHREVLL
ncbi:MAG TPA: fumarate hydratase [Syntrophales bacterium]|jgi:fumarate hydratase subunit alpha|nr:fumarate hydratase [Syntrophales bacterium]HQA83273.1 fumarate hydratase [Syntrophales bacterium]